jgi:hypothetical protein
MSNRYKGSILSSTAAATSSTAAAGLWKQTEVAQLIGSAWYVNDPSWSSVSIMLHGDGVGAAQNNTFIDSSANAITITQNSTATQGTYSPFGSTAPYATTNGGSGFFNGTSDYLTVTANTVFSYTTGDFTWECWVYPTAFGAAAGSTIDFWSNASGSYIVGQCQLQVNTTGTVQFYYATTASALASIVTSTTLSLNTWAHIAVVRSGSGTGNLKIYINGVSSATSAGAVTQNLGSTGTGSIGRQTNITGTAYYFTGYISNARIVKGVAVYTGAFTVPTSPLASTQSAGTNISAITGTQTSLLLSFINANVIDNAMQSNWVTGGGAQISNAYKYGTGSVNFNGTSNYLLNSSTTTSVFGANDFTVEFWILVSSLPSVLAQIFDTRPISTNGFYPVIYLNSDGTVRFFTNSLDRITSSALSTNTWYHIAVCKASGSTRMFINGTQTGSTYTDANTYLSSKTFIGGSYAGQAVIAYFFNGFIDDLRITKGVARYTTTFTPPQQAFPNQ